MDTASVPLARLPMISFEPKSSMKSIDFTEIISKYIASTYQDDASQYKRDFDRLNELRESCANASKDNLGCEMLKKYYYHLTCLSKKFPIEKNDDIEFIWYDYYDESISSSPDLLYEKLCILHNIACLYSFFGAERSRSSDEAIRQSCIEFQLAAGCFSSLKQTLDESVFEFKTDMMGFKTQTLLAQAQECALEKSIMDKRKSKIISKVSYQVAMYYEEALKHVENLVAQDNISSKQAKEWKSYTCFKINYSKAITYYYNSLTFLEASQYGETIACLQFAKKQLDELSKSKAPSDFAESLKNLSLFIDSKLQAVTKENDFVYHARIPSFENLEKIEGANLVKFLPLNLDDISSKEADLFSRLVPMQVYEKSSLYSEEKAKILRNVNSSVEEKNLKLCKFLSAIDLNDLEKDSEFLKMPSELIECCASLSVRNTVVDDLSEKTQDFHELHEKIEEKIDAISTTLKKITEMSPEKASELRASYAEMKRAYTLIWNEVTKSLNPDLIAAIDNLKILSLPMKDLETHLPKCEFTEDDKIKSLKERLKLLLAKVNEMKQQRDQLVNTLRENIKNDDITRKLADAGTDTDNKELFKSHLQKHEQIVDYINQNLSAQENILRSLAESNAEYANYRQMLSEAMQKRNSYINTLLSSYNHIDELMKKSQTFISILAKHRNSFEDLEAKCASFIDTQNAKQFAKPNNIDPMAINNHLSDIQYQNTNFDMNNYNYNIPMSNNMMSAPVFNAPNINNQKNMPKSASITSEPALSSGGGGALRLKDFLAIMKPDSWGKTNGNAPPMNPTNFNEKAAIINDYTRNIQSPHSQLNTPPITEMKNMNLANQHNIPAAAYQQQQQIANQPPANSLNFGANSMAFDPRQNAPMNNSVNMNDYSSINPPQSYPNQMPMNYANYQVLPTPNPMLNQAQIAPTPQPPAQSFTNFSVPTFKPPNQSSSAKPVITQQQQSPSIPNTTQQPPQANLYSNAQPQPAQIINQPKFNAQTPIPNYTQNVMPQQPQMPLNPMVQPQIRPNMAPTPLISQPYNPSILPNQIPPNMLQQQQQQQQQPNALLNQNVPNFTPTPSVNQIAPINTTQNFNKMQPNVQQMASSANQVPMATNSAQSQPVYSQAPINTTAPNPYQPNLNPYQAQIYQPMHQQLNSNPYPTNLANNQMMAPNYQQMTPTQFNPHPQMMPQQQQQLQPQVPKSNVDILNDLLKMDNNYQVNGGEQQSSLTELTVLTPQKFAEKDSKNDEKMEEKKDEATENGYENSLLSDLKIEQKISALQQAEATKSQQSINTFQIALSEVIGPRNINAKNDSSVFLDEVLKLQSHVLNLETKSLNGLAPIDKEWKEISDYQERETKEFSISVARCYPLKNRFADALPFDQTRVILSSKTSDNYINASFVGHTVPIEINSDKNPFFICAQTPMNTDLFDFWSLIIQQHCSILVSFEEQPDVQLLKTFAKFWPTNEKPSLRVFSITVNLVSAHDSIDFEVRKCVVTDSQSNLSTNVTHMHYKSRVVQQDQSVNNIELQTNYNNFADFISAVQSSFTSNSSDENKILVACSNGISLSGVFIALYSAIQVINKFYSLPNLLGFIKYMRKKRKNMIKTKNELKYCYEFLLNYCKNILTNEGVWKHQICLSPSIRDTQPSLMIMNDGTKTPVISPNFSSQMKASAKINLLDLTNPENFNASFLDIDTNKPKNKFTKQDFLASMKSVNPKESSLSTNDPFSLLDPLYNKK